MNQRAAFRDLHRDGIFVMPNPFDVGSAKLLESIGFPAVTTTSSGHAATLGRKDGAVDRAELIDHVASLARAVEIPLSVDAEHGFGLDPADAAATLAALAEAGASGCSIEDFNPAAGAADPVEVSVARIEAAMAVADHAGMVLTGRADGLLHGQTDVGEVIERLVAYAEAGAHCVYAPGLRDPNDIRTAVNATGVAVNVLALPGVPTVQELADLGVRRVSVGGALAFAGYEAFRSQAQQLHDHGTYDYLSAVLPADVRNDVFDDR